MIQKEIAKLGQTAFSQSLHPLKKKRLASSVLIVGLDTEYDSVTKELLCWTFSYQGNQHIEFVEPGEKYDWPKLERVVYEFLRSSGVSINKRHVSAIKLICYFSLAETQHLMDIQQSTVFETSVGVDFVYKGTGKRTLEIVDLMKFFNSPAQPLAKVAEAFGLKKLDWERDKISRADFDKPGFIDYAINDAILAEVIFNRLRAQYIDAYNVDIVLTKTPAQTSSAIYRLNFLDRTCTQPDSYIRKLALSCCWGGRNEAYLRGVFPTDEKQPWFEYDAFSEYPNSAIQIGILPAEKDWLLAESNDDIRKYHGISRVLFRFPDHVQYPCLPVFADRSPENGKKGAGKLYYPLSGETWSTNTEIRFALELGADVELIEGYCYETGTTTLAEYMAHFLKARSEAKAKGDKIAAHVIKLALNSLIGKFVQRVTKSDLNALVELSNILQIPPHELRRFSPEALAESVKDLDFDLSKLHHVSVGNSFYPEWNALILGYARSSTSRFIHDLATRGYDIGITSTDSVIFRQNSRTTEPAETYTHNGIIFERRERGAHMSIVRTRLYRLGKDVPKFRDDFTDENELKLAHHAVPRKKTARLMFDAFIKDPTIPEFHYEMNRLQTYRESVVYGKEYGADVTFADRKTRLGWDGKRKLDNGFRSNPWRTLDTQI